MVTKASEYMAKYANCSQHNIQFMVGDFIWLLSQHLSFPNLLTCKLAAKFARPYEVLQVINTVAYCLAVLLTWHIYNVLHFS